MTQSPDPGLARAVHADHGHHVYESGHHGDLWLDLDALFARPAEVTGWARSLAAALPAAEVVLGPLTGGAFLAQAVATCSGALFAHAERLVVAGGVRYRVPGAQRQLLHGRRVLVVDDVVNAASALSATADDALACGARLAGVGALVALGPAGDDLAASHRVPFACLARWERLIWPPAGCPLCAAGVPVGRRG